MNTHLSKNTLTLLFFLGILQYNQIVQAQAPQWPLEEETTYDHWWRVSALFGEIHTNIHRGLDIDHSLPNQDFYPIIQGLILLGNGGVNPATPGIGGDSFTIEHLHGPAGGINDGYGRRTRYLHITHDPSLSEEDTVFTTIPMGTLDNGGTGLGDHLHLEMWEYINGDWYSLNPLRNDMNWTIDLPVGHPDDADPVINNVYIRGMNGQSGAYVLNTAASNGALLSTTLSGNDVIRVHYSNATGNNPGGTGDPTAIYDDNVDALAMYGQVAPIINCRDIAINSPETSNDGASVYSVKYTFGDMPADLQDKFSIVFDRIHYEDDYNQQYAIFDNASQLYGNNDFIKLFVNTPANFTHPHKTVDYDGANIQSNGIWQTRAKSSTDAVFEQTPTDLASVSKEALFPDGNHYMQYEVEDADERNDEVDLKVVINNFRPYIDSISIYNIDNFAGDSVQVYEAHWDWDPDFNNGAGATPGKLSLVQNNISDASGNQPLGFANHPNRRQKHPHKQKSLKKYL